MRQTDLQSYETASHNFIEKYCPSIPIPYIIEEWTDSDREYHFTQMTTIYGVSLSRAWTNLSQTQKQQLAIDVAGHLRTLRKFKSDRMQSVSGKSLKNNWFIPRGHGTRTTRLWKTDDEIFDSAYRPVLEYKGIFARRIQLIRDLMPPCVGQFAFYHGDLYHGNIMVSARTGQLTGIIDWEFAGYYPLWFHYARLRFHVPNKSQIVDTEWKSLLAEVIRDEIPYATHGLVWWHAVWELIDNPKSQKGRDWLDLLADWIGGYEIVMPIEEYERYRSKDWV
ncbi:hypothetical protein QBC38DRAFT_485848 [Podospora fimiseda]|uniref:Aminoglycoside phosphotransferase domain-containing protein n=1 Tax=Podospora fimiseda TaxID=252190 RepID=A0AAN7BIX9_9PEZI|nr:hypothetical protein QBC38DRAFT_485848 [Podospora fimiseda]